MVHEASVVKEAQPSVEAGSSSDGMPSSGQNSRDPSLGHRLRELRKDKGMTLTELSERTRTPISTLSRIENDRIALSFKRALELAVALQVPVTAFLGPQGGDAPGRRAITRLDEGLHQTMTQRLEYETLCDELTDKRNLYWKVTVHCRSLEDYGHYSRHPGEEFILVLSGKFDLHTEHYKPARLSKGDSICFDSSSGHAYVAVSRKPPVLLMSNSLPLFPSPRNQ